MDPTRVRCPWCHDDLDGEAELAVCEDCLAPHHAVCWLGRCASCARTRRIGAPRVAPPTGWEPLAACAAMPLFLGPTLLVTGGVVDLLGAESAAQSLYFGFALWLALGAAAMGLALVSAGLLCLGYLAERLLAPEPRIHVVARRAELAGVAPTRSRPRCSPVGSARSW